MPVRDLILHLKETRSGNALLDAANDLDRASRGVDKFGESSKATTKDLAGLRAEVERSTRAAKDLKLQIARTGDQSLFGDLRKEEANLKRFQKLLADFGPAKGGGIGIPSIGGIPGPVIAGGAGLLAALTPMIGATVAAAVLGGVGTGGVIGGVALAAQDTRVRSAFKDVGREVFEGLGDAASPFVEPLVDSAATFGDAWRKEAPAFQKNFATLAEAVAPLTEGVTGFVRNIGPGLGNAFRASIPLAEQFGEDLSDMGEDVSDFLDDMADSAPGARKAMHDLFVVTGEFLDLAGGGIKVLSGIYDGLNRIGITAERLIDAGKELVPMSGPLGDLADAFNAVDPDLGKSVKDLGDPTERLAREMEEAADAADKQTRALERLGREVDEYYDAILGPLDAEERWAESLLDLNDSLAENGKTLSMNTREGLANRDAIEERFRAAKELLDAGKLTEAQYLKEIEQLAQLGRKFNDTTGFVAGLVEAYKRLPSQIFTELIVNTTIGGMAGRLFKDFFGIVPAPRLPGSQSLGAAVSGPGHGAFLDLPHRASGGPVLAGHAYMVGERGPEPFIPSTNGTILPNGAGTQIVVTLDPGITGHSRDIAAALVQMLQFKVRTLSGGNVQKALGQ